MSKLKYRCAAHPDVESEIHWACPDCLYQAKREISDLEQRLAEAEGWHRRALQLENYWVTVIEPLKAQLTVAEGKIAAAKVLPDRWERKGVSGDQAAIELRRVLADEEQSAG